MYFSGILTGAKPDYSHVLGQMFPYVVRDAYGTTVLPENLGDYEPEPFYQFPVHLVPDILAGAAAESVVRNGIAGVYFHPFEGVAPLSQIVTGLRAQGWTFVSPLKSQRRDRERRSHAVRTTRDRETSASSSRYAATRRTRSRRSSARSRRTTRPLEEAAEPTRGEHWSRRSSG